MKSSASKLGLRHNNWTHYFIILLFRFLGSTQKYYEVLCGCCFSQSMTHRFVQQTESCHHVPKTMTSLTKSCSLENLVLVKPPWSKVILNQMKLLLHPFCLLLVSARFLVTPYKIRNRKMHVLFCILYLWQKCAALNDTFSATGFERWTL